MFYKDGNGLGQRLVDEDRGHVVRSLLFSPVSVIKSHKFGFYAIEIK
jgi:hypothetical protein